jgi:hypothetical protein
MNNGKTGSVGLPIRHRRRGAGGARHRIPVHSCLMIVASGTLVIAIAILLVGFVH